MNVFFDTGLSYPEVLAGRVARGEIALYKAVRWLMSNGPMTVDTAQELMHKASDANANTQDRG